MTAAKKKQAASVLDQRWPYSYVSTPILWALATWGVAVAVYGLAIGTWWVAGVGALIAVLVAVAVPDGAGLFTLALGAAATTYLTWCAAGTPFTRDAALILIPGAAIFGVWWHLVTIIPPDPEAKATAAFEAAAHDGDLPRILANAGFRGIKAAGPVEYFEAGRTQRLQLPASGNVEFKHLQAATTKIQIAARARFPIRFTPGDHLAEVVAIILDKDVLAETLDYPIDRSARSIHDPMPLGKDELGNVQYVTFRELSAMFVGERGSGKSGLINSHLAYLTGCTDALVWMIDGKGGRTARPWLKPFLDGLGKPAIDWVATTQAEADFMLLAARELIEHRSRGEGEKVEPNPGQPAVILIVEEASIILGSGSTANAARASLAKDTVVLGRSEAVDVILVAQRGTVTMLGSGDMKSQLQYVVGLGISKLEDAVRIFGEAGIAREILRYAGDLAYRGVMLVKAPGWRTVLPVKGWWLGGALIPGVALTNAAHQPELEPDAVEHLETVLRQAECPGGYAGRWDRYRDGLAHGVTHGVTQTAQVDTPRQVAQTGPGEPPVDTPRESPGESRRETPAELVARVKAEQKAKFESAAFARLMSQEWDTENDTWREPVESPELTWNPEVIPPFLGCLMSLFCGESEDFLSTEFILDQPTFAGLTAKRLSVLANHMGFTSVEVAKVRGYNWIDVSHAFKRARDTGAPAAAFTWRP